jgi:dTDP-glucose 4,6-dehydratase
MASRIVGTQRLFIHTYYYNNPMSILVTGGAGFIGSCFIRQWAETRGSCVINLDKLTYAGDLKSLQHLTVHQHQFVHGDICNRELVECILKEYKPSAIIHFAAESHVDRSIDGPLTFVQTNVMGTATLLECARHYWKELDNGERKAFRFLHVSTDEVFGSLGDTGYFVESTPYNPRSPYSASKASSDHLVRAYHETYGLPVLITNCSNNYGPFQFPEKLIPLMTLNAIEGKPLPVYGDGLNVRDWLFVEDHCSAIRTVLDAGVTGDTYTIGGNCERSNIEIVNTICAAVQDFLPNLPHRCIELIHYVKDRPGHDRRYAIDASKIKFDLGWSPSFQFDVGIRSTVRWYIENRDWVERIQSGRYQRERLGTHT